MHLECKVSLTEHNFPIGKSHKLIPSVYAYCNHHKDSEKIGYSGPTYIGIQSAKNDKSCATSPKENFERILSLKEFRNSCRNEDALVKLLVFPSDDGGSDEVLKNQQSLSSLSKIFVNNDLDALIVFNQAPASSGYNPVKRRMAPLIRDTAGLTLPFDKLLSHLNPPNETIDVEIEK